MGDIINYGITVTNTGLAEIASLQLIDDYPEEFLRPLRSDLPWDDDNLSALTWNNLLNLPLHSGQSIPVNIEFEVIAASDMMVVNLARVRGTMEGNGADLVAEMADGIIVPINPNCPSVGPASGCVGVPVAFSAPAGLDGYEWIALDASGRSVGGFDDTSKYKTNWTPPAKGTFRISYDDMVCSQQITVDQCQERKGLIVLEKTLQSDQDDIQVGDTIDYSITITNIGQTRIVSLPLIDDYPEEFMKPLRSDRSWNDDNLSALAWDNLLASPLQPGQSIQVNIDFRAIAASDLTVTNTARAIAAIDENGVKLDSRTADCLIPAISSSNCPSFGPSSGCVGIPVAFSAPSWQEGYEWTALDGSGRSAGGFDDTSKAKANWTPPAAGTFSVSYNDMVCSQRITVNQCRISRGQISLEKTLVSSRDDIKAGDIINFSITMTNIVQAKVVSLPLVDDYPEEFLQPLSSDLPWDDDNLSALAWDNLLASPLQPGQSIQVNIDFRAIAASDLMVTNTARAIAAIDENGVELEAQTADCLIPAISSSNCPSIGPSSGCVGIPVTFSAPSWQDGYEWIALDGSGRSAGGFDDTSKAKANWTPPAAGTFSVSYNDMICSQRITVKEPSLYISKTAEKGAYAPEDIVKYTLSYGNDFDLDANEVTVYDVLPDVEYLNSTPDPDYIKGNILIWRIGTMKPRTNGSIEISVKIKERPDVRFEESQSVSGTGYAYSRKRLSTSMESQSLANYANITAFLGREFDSSTATILIQDARGTEVETAGHGSGSYHKEEDVLLLTENKTIQVSTSLSERHSPTSFALPGGRSVHYDSRWSEAQTAKNRQTGASIEERYMYATRIDRNSSLMLDKNGSTLAAETSFEGAGHLAMIKLPTNNSSLRQDAPVYESREDYLGSFQVDTEFDEYGKNVVSRRSASGTGWESSERRMAKSQMSYDSGTGTYQAEDQFQTQTSFMAKEINASYGPADFAYSRDTDITSSNRWREGMWSRSGTSSAKSGSSQPTSFMGEEISAADRLDKSTVAEGLSRMNSSGEFSGTGRFKVVKTGSTKTADVAFYEEYIGRYKVARSIEIGGVARFDEPHLSVSKAGMMESAGSTFVDYVISVSNDGNQALGPVHVLDLFPPNTEYIYSSLRPSELNGSYAGWELANLGIGETSTIELRLNMTEYSDNLVNRVQATGGYEDKWITAGNFSVIELNWLGCLPMQVFAAKTARIDAKDPYLVHYRILLKNREEHIVAVTIADRLPEGMIFQNSSIPPADRSSDGILWSILNLKPGETRCIDYAVKALQGGVFVNQAHIEVHPLDGSDFAAVDVASSVEVGGARRGSTSTWQPPECFGLNCTQQDFGDEWMPCYTCGAMEPQPIDVACSSCVSSAGSDSDIP